MEWWSNFLSWLATDTAAFVLTSIVVPVVSVIAAGLLASWIARGSVKRLLHKHDRELSAAALSAVIDAAQQAAAWNSLTPQERLLSDRATSQVDIQLRLLPLAASAIVADWARHTLTNMKQKSATFGYQSEPAVLEFRDRLIAWHHRPRKTRRGFENDLQRWKITANENDIILQNQQGNRIVRSEDPNAQKKRGLPENTASSVDNLGFDAQRVLDQVNAVEREIEPGIQSRSA